MNTIQYSSGGRTVALPIDTAVSQLIAHLQQPNKTTSAPAQARHKIGEYLADQGGIYIGDTQGDDGVLYGLIIAEQMQMLDGAFHRQTGNQ